LEQKRLATCSDEIFKIITKGLTMVLFFAIEEKQSIRLYRGRGLAIVALLGEQFSDPTSKPFETHSRTGGAICEGPNQATEIPEGL
jgi:hypothetical protein